MSKRLDVFITEKALTKSRAKAKELILNGCVSVNGNVVSKPSVNVEENDDIIVCDKEQYVGRGALKLKTAFDCFNLNVSGKRCADIGASTGGFTQILLKNGAKKVYAVDVGHNQLDKELINDKRVCNCEGVNVKDLTPEFFEEQIHFICGDLSFISLKLVIPPLVKCLSQGGEMVMLIKPQFEVGKKALNKKGIAKNKKDHVRILYELTEFFKMSGLSVLGLKESAITGAEGNIEYLVYLSKCDQEPKKSKSFDIKELVDSAFKKFNK